MESDSPSSWFVFNDDTSVEEHRLADVCHAELAYHESGIYDQCITGVPRDSDADLAYITFLIDGPFRAFRDRISLLQDEASQKYYLHCTKLDTWPANVLYNFCIATRTPIEFPHLIKCWSQMTKAGVNEALAFQFASRITFNENAYRYNGERKPPQGDPWDWKLDSIMCPRGHFWFDPTSSWSSLLEGRPLVKAFSTNYKENPKTATPCNVIWGKSNRAEASQLVGKTVKELTQFFELNKLDVLADMVEEFKDVPVPAIAEAPMHILDDDFDDDDHFDDDDDDLFVELDDDDDLDF